MFSLYSHGILGVVFTWFISITFNNCYTCRIRHGVSFGVCRPPDGHLDVQVACCLMDCLCRVVAVRATLIRCSPVGTSSAGHFSLLQRCDFQYVQSHSRSHIVDLFRCPHLLDAASTPAVPVSDSEFSISSVKNLQVSSSIVTIESIIRNAVSFMRTVVLTMTSFADHCCRSYLPTHQLEFRPRLSVVTKKDPWSWLARVQQSLDIPTVARTQRDPVPEEFQMSLYFPSTPRAMVPPLCRRRSASSNSSLHWWTWWPLPPVWCADATNEYAMPMMLLTLPWPEPHVSSSESHRESHIHRGSRRMRMCTHLTRCSKRHASRHEKNSSIPRGRSVQSGQQRAQKPTNSQSVWMDQHVKISWDWMEWGAFTHERESTGLWQHPIYRRMCDERESRCSIPCLLASSRNGAREVALFCTIVRNRKEVHRVLDEFLILLSSISQEVPARAVDDADVSVW